MYKFIWVLSGQLELDVDHQSVVLKEGQLLTLSHLHHVDFVRVDGEYLSLLFNSNFYCIYGNDHEVSCNGLLFHGSSHVVIFDLSGEERRKIATLTGIMREEFESRDHLQDETAPRAVETLYYIMYAYRRKQAGRKEGKRNAVRDDSQVLCSGRYPFQRKETSAGICRYAE